MQTEESGVVVQVRGSTALVRLTRSSACSGCASAGQCRTVGGGNEKLLEAHNEAGAVAGDAVRVAVSMRAVLGSSARRHLLPVACLLVGAAVAQTLAGTLFSTEAGGVAAGIGGIAGLIFGLVLGRRKVNATGVRKPPLPRITRVVPHVDSPGCRD